MIKATKSNSFSLSAGLVNADNSMETGATVTYSIRNAADDTLVASGSMTESAVKPGLYYANVTISTVGDYRAYISSSTFPDITEDIQVTEEETFIEIIKKVETGRWKIINNQMIFYDDDGVTPLYTFDLKDADGDATSQNVFERIAA